MKAKRMIFFLLTCMWFSFQNVSMAQSLYQELLIGIPSLNVKQVMLMKEKSQAWNAIQMKGYSLEARCIILAYDAAVYPDATPVLNLAAESLPGIQFFLKETDDLTLLEQSYRMVWFKDTKAVTE